MIAMDEIRHPTYGTLDSLMVAIKHDVQQCYQLRLGLLGALNWFTHEYGLRHAESEPAETGESR